MTAIKIIAELPNLTKRDRTLIRAALEKLDTEVDTPGPLFEVLMKTAGSNIPYANFRRMKHFKLWLEREQWIMCFIARGWPSANKVALNSLKHFLFGILADDLKKRGIEVTVNTLILNAGRVPALFEVQFPHYLSAGLGSVVLMHLVSRNGKSSLKEEPTNA